MRRLIEELESRRMLSTYYVSTAGSDSNSGSQSSPLATIQVAANLAQPGDTVNVEAGTYGGFVLSWDNPQAGTAGAPITIQADPAAPAGSVIIASRDNKTPVGIDLEPGSDYVVINGFTVIDGDGSITQEGIKATGNNDSITHDTVTGVGGFGIFTDNANNALIEYDTITGTQGTDTTGHGIYVSGTCSGVVIEFNTIDGNGYHGIHLNGDASEGGVGEVINALIANNLIFNNPGNGINGDGLVNSVIENNLIYGYTNNGISLYQIDAGVPSTGNVIVNNTIETPVGGYNSIELQDGAAGNIVFNNVMLGGFLVDDTSSDIASNNINSGTDLLLFVDSLIGNYQLAGGSPAIGAGVVSFDGISAPSTDLSGNVRVDGRFDAGAYEFDSTPANPPATPGNISATQGTTAGGVTITWSAAANATSYQVFRSTTDDVTTALKITGGVATTGFVDTTAAPGQTYFYWVRARNLAIMGNYSGVASGFELGAPANVAASTTLAGEVEITWSAQAGAASYQVFRGTTSDPTAAVKIVGGISATDFEDTTATPGVLYYYWVRGRNPGNIGQFSSAATGSAPLLSPDQVTAAVGPVSGEVTVQWDTVAGAAGYQVFRSTTDDVSTAVKIGFGIVGDSFIDTTIQSGQTYYYWVRGRNPVSIGILGGPGIVNT